MLYSTHFRPVPLQEMVKIGSTLYDTDFKKIREIPSTADPSNDEQDIIGLCQETVTGGHSVLVFCPTKQWCEISAAPFLQQTSTARASEAKIPARASEPEIPARASKPEMLVEEKEKL